jgi:hypothetical protein
MNIYSKLFLHGGIPFGLLMGIFSSLQNGFHSGLMTGALSGISFGVFLSLTLGFLHRRSVEKMPFGNSEEAMGVGHGRNVELRLPYHEVFDLCIDSLNLIKRSKIREENRSQGKIVARGGITWKTWGDVISFSIRNTGNDGIQVEVSSRPALRWTLVDYGKNLENVERILSFLEAHARRTACE